MLRIAVFLVFFLAILHLFLDFTLFFSCRIFLHLFCAYHKMFRIIYFPQVNHVMEYFGMLTKPWNILEMMIKLEFKL